MGVNNETCDCDVSVQYYTWGSNCVLCSDLILGCTTCSDNATCTVCNTAGYFRL